jgi:hypothetical protein
VQWWPAAGNHDLMVQGELPPSPSTDAIATGDEALHTFDPSLEGLIDELPRGGGDGSPDLRDVPRAAIDALLASGIPGRTTTVPPDAVRRHLRRADMVRRLRVAANLNGVGERLNHATDIGRGVRLVVLDTVDGAGGAGGVVTPAEVAFLRNQLETAGDRAVIVVSHHGLHRARGGEAAQALLGDDPRVVAELFGDTHRHEIRPVRTRAGGYWRISTSSLADWPQQGRMLRLVSGADGSRAIETWVVDHAGAIDGGDVAGAARRLAYLDAQGGRPQRFAGEASDRNVRLWLPSR